MKIDDLIKLSVRNLMRRRTRTILTVAGVIVGTTAIISMFGLSAGLSKSIDTTIANLGDLTMLEIYNTGVYVDGNGEYQLTSNNLTDDMVQMLRYGMDEVLAVCPMIQPENAGFIIQAGPRYEMPYAAIVGVEPEALSFFHFEIASGEAPSSSDDNFIMFGAESLYQFVDPNKPSSALKNQNASSLRMRDYDENGKRKKPEVDVFSEELVVRSYMPDATEAEPLRRYRFDKVSILATNPTDQTNEYLIFMNIRSVREMIAEQERIKHTASSKSELNSYSSIKLRAKSIEAADELSSKLSEMGIAAYGLSDYRKEMISSKNSIEIILRFIGIMALFVSTIGISNTTIMSIYERTSEIGVMKVLGCPVGAISALFLMESAVIGFIGGCIGSALSVLISVAINHIPNLSIISGVDTSLDVSVISPLLVIASITFSTLIGLVAGALPSRRATKITVLEAIKNVG